MYYILFDEVVDSDQDAILEGEYEDLETEDFPFNTGVPIMKPGFDIPVVFELYINIMRGEMTDNLSVDSIEGLVISDKTKEFLSQNQMGDFQFFPMQMIDKYSNLEEVQMAEFRDEKLDYKTITYNNYHIANVIGLIDCIDHEASDLEYFVPRPEISDDMPEEMKKVLQEEAEDLDIDFIRKLVLDESKIPEDIMIFRLKDCPRILVFKEKIVNAIREEKLTGFVFTLLSEYTDEIPDDDDDEEEGNEAKEAEKSQVEVVPERFEEKVEEASKPKKSIIIKKIKKN